MVIKMKFTPHYHDIHVSKCISTAKCNLRKYARNDTFVSISVLRVLTLFFPNRAIINCHMRYAELCSVRVRVPSHSAKSLAMQPALKSVTLKGGQLVDHTHLRIGCGLS